ncbi:MAG TPA: hypothetical protein VN809_01680 [Telmatospirillum sp.]|nr:hypothetical protein [Telmatospirillum sp.]
MDVPNYAYFVLGVLAVCLVFGGFRFASSKKVARASVVMPSEAKTVEVAKEVDDFVPTELCFGSSEDRPALTVSAFSGSLKALGSRRMDVENSRINLLSPMLQMAPEVITAAEVQAGKYMKVVVNGPLAKCSDGEGFRGYVVGKNGIKEQARLFEPNKLKNIVNAAAVWQFASVVVAQKHMADINEKLKEIKDGINEIVTFLHDERQSKLTGAIQYLDQAKDAILRGEFPDAIRHQLESLERDMINAEHHLLKELRDLTDAISRIEHDEWFGTEEFAKAISTHQDKIERVREELLLCLDARVANWLVLAAFPDEDAVKEARFAAIQSSFEVLDKDGELGRTAFRNMKDKINEIESAWNSAETLRERRKSLMERSEIYRTNFQVQTLGSRVIFDATKTMLSVDRMVPLELAVRMDGGKVVEAYDISEA